MFIQVIQGRISDRDEVKEAMDRWARELAPGAIGWLGSTAGVTDDDMFIGLARFESPEAARRNSDRPEQGQWWAEVSKLFTHEVQFHDCRECGTWLEGGRDDAGFVQIMQNRVRDLGALRTLMEREDPTELRGLRPEIIGGVWAAHGDGGLTQAIYFTSEAEAREGERKEMPEEMRAQMTEMEQLFEGDTAFFDLKDPWLYAR